MTGEPLTTGSAGDIAPGPNGPDATRRIGYAPIALVAFLGSLATWLLFTQVSTLEQQGARDAFSEAARDRVLALRREAAYALGIVQDVGSFFDAAHTVTRRQFREFVGPVLRRHLGIHALLWIPRVEAGARAAFVEQARRTFAPFEITRLGSPTGATEAAAGAVLYPILYIQPYSANKPLLGADLATSPQIAAVLAQAAADRALRMSPPITIPIDPSLPVSRRPHSLVGIGAFLPVFDRREPDSSPLGEDIDSGDLADDNRLLRGFAAGLFPVRDLVDRALAYLRPSGVDMRLYADEPGAEARPIHTHISRTREGGASGTDLPPATTDWSYQDRIQVADQTWTLVSSPVPGYFEPEQWGSRLILGAGAGFTLLACIYLYTLIGRAQQVRRLVAERTRQLERSNAALNSALAERERAEGALQRLNLTLEHRVERRTAESERRARDLEQFAYVASHDLKAPLRGIANLASWLSEDLADRLTPEAAEQLDLLRDRVTRMHALIEGLLSYSRVGRTKRPAEPIDTARLVSDTVDSLAPPPGFSVEVASGMPRLVGDRLHLGQVFANLIGNAIKHHDRPQGRVRVSGRRAGGYCELTVEDDGPGIPVEFQERVFRMFQTLQVKDVEGNTGIGLALVKKLVEEHGGRISLQSGPGRGCRFVFTWPEKPPKTEQPSSERLPEPGREAR